MTSPLPNEERNARRFIWSNGLQNIGDQIVAPKTTLPWLFSAAGVPAVLTSFLVPIRESGSMLPQAFLSPWVTSQRSRKRVWLIGSWGQFLAATLLAVSALLLDGAALGAAVLALLAVHAVFRSICSLAGKDVQGRTISSTASWVSPMLSICQVMQRRPSSRYIGRPSSQLE